MINSLPELVLLTIFNYFTDAERICVLALVCRQWYDIVHSGMILYTVALYGRKLTLTIREK